MVRRRIKERSKARFTEDMMAGAVKSVVEDGLSLRSAAQIHGVKLPTLQRYVHKKKNNPEINVRMAPNYTVRLVFTQEQEADLSRYLRICSKMSYGLSTNQVKKLAYETAIRDKIKVPTSWDNNKCAGRDWLMAFMKRCGGLNIIRPPSGCSLSLLPYINPHYVTKYFQNLEEIFTRIPSLITTDNRIYNLGEISTTAVKKLDEGSINEAGEVVTTCAFICADGTFLPPVMIFPQNYLNQNVKITHGAPQGTFGCASPSGRMTQFLFGAALGHFISLSGSSKNNPTLLIYENQESHISIAAVDQAMEAGVILVTLPPRSNNKLQPLDVSILPSFKTHYNTAMESCKSNHPDTSFTFNQVAECVGEAYPKSFTPDNIKLGFKNTGIFPFDKNILESDLDFRMSLTSHGSRCQEGLNANSEFDNFGQPGPSQSREQNAEPRISSQYFTVHDDFEISDFISQKEIKKDLLKQRLYPDVEKDYMFPKKEVPDNQETVTEEIESVFITEGLDSPIGAESPSFDNDFEPMQTSEITNNDRQTEKNRTFVEHIYQVLMQLPPSKANQVRHRVYNILFQAEEECETFVNQIGSSSNTFDRDVVVKYENI